MTIATQKLGRASVISELSPPGWNGSRNIGQG
jgi:hypothetical protein